MGTPPRASRRSRRPESFRCSAASQIGPLSRSITEVSIRNLRTSSGCESKTASPRYAATLGSHPPMSPMHTASLCWAMAVASSETPAGHPSVRRVSASTSCAERSRPVSATTAAHSAADIARSASRRWSSDRPAMSVPNGMSRSVRDAITSRDPRGMLRIARPTMSRAPAACSWWASSRTSTNRAVHAARAAASCSAGPPAAAAFTCRPPLSEASAARIVSASTDGSLWPSSSEIQA